jgi:hypothetical protein
VIKKQMIQPKKREFEEEDYNENPTFKERAKNTFNAGKERFFQARETTRETIRQNPFTSVIISAAVGALIGIGVNEILQKKRRKERNSFLKRIKRMF